MPRSIVVLALLVAACDSDTPPSGRGAGMNQRGRAGETAEYTPSSSSGAFEPPRRRVAPSEMPPAPPPPPPPAPPRPSREAPPRDLGAELAASVGDPSGCFTDLPAEVRSASIFISATVFEDGVLSSVSVSASPGSPAANRCVQRMADAARLAGGIPNAPRPISTRLEVRR